MTGQDGSYLADLLVEKGYEVVGVVRRSSTEPFERIYHLEGKVRIVQADLLDQGSISGVIADVRPDEVYNLAAQSFVPTSWALPVYTGEVTGLGVTRVLQALRHMKGDTKFYQASSSEMFGKVVETPQNENTPFYPRSPYGVAKVYGHYITKNYRESYDMFACSGILFNHESERRGLEFVTRKITDHVARQAAGHTKEPLVLGNLEAKRDWGYAPDYVEAMWLMLQQDEPDDYVISSGDSHSVREFVESAYKAAGIGQITWHGEGVNEVGLASRHPGPPDQMVGVSEEFFRPAEVMLLQGDYSKAWNKLSWKPKHSFEQLVEKMVVADMRRHAFRLK
jgi:GDPmannose 4,6-dehydratase